MTNFVGFKGFTKPAKIDGDLVTKKLDRMAVDNLYVYFTGGAYRFRKGSGRSAALQTVTEVKKPIPVKTLIERAAKAHGDKGYSPDMVRAGLFLHAGSKPAVYLPLERREDGAYVAAKDIPNPDGFSKALKAGDVVIPAGTKKALAAPKPKGKNVARPTA